LIQSLGEWALRQACRDLQKWDLKGLAVGRLAVNVSAHQVMQPGFAHTIERVLAESEVDPERLCLEITESVFLADASRALAVLAAVKQLGVSLSLDDFGTGYSSLRYLRHFPVDVVKIDRTFTEDVPTDKATKAVVRAIIDLSHVLDLSVTAEGVQTPGQLTEIIDLGADHAQGFHISYPLPSSELSDYVGDRRVNGWSVPGKGSQPVA
jgi:EAL domain-containing protein (putative c-di-GMP-specific phosphodiesterase class I)